MKKWGYIIEGQTYSNGPDYNNISGSLYSRTED